ncbi:FHA domain/PPIC-type PPIASE domain containing protein, putative [Angomonas deanei]|uniref:FHA domain/PPIC-type PPIASE domain containing protein, putative n=1 Tax=Angomonas deanei TaxID=59799 RepID=A0A7G2CHH7_9TRYP|nr:FHA domain/PPIC-type PPIASE domain containing protein, putative [Angomonas deanei]
MSSFARLTQLDEAAQFKQKDTRERTVPLSEEALALPEHIIKCTDPVKLNMQVQFFKCPAWAGLPAKAYHLHCTREGQVFPALALDRFPFYLLGKSDKCDYRLEHPSVSAIHAAIVFHKEQNCFVIVDLRSTNGVRVNDARITPEKPVPLAVGSIIRLGHSTRRYELRLGKATKAEPNNKRPHEAVQEPAEVQASKSVKPDAPVVPPTVVHPSPPDEAPPLPDAEEKDRTAAVEHEDRAKVFHLFQLVIKHKGVDKPKVRRTGEVVTRSKEDAFELAQFILKKHPEKQWTLEEFLAVVEEYCEVRAEGKNGDLKQVSPGTYSEEFDAHVFQLNRKEVSAPFESRLGIHLVYRCD